MSVQHRPPAKVTRCRYHVWPDDGERRGERCVSDEGHEGDHEFSDQADARIASAASPHGPPRARPKPRHRPRIASSAAESPRQELYLVGKIVGTVTDEEDPSSWQYQGLWTERDAAVRQCAGRRLWFVAPVTVDVGLADEKSDWQGCFYPYDEPPPGPPNQTVRDPGIVADGALLAVLSILSVILAVGGLI